jgi:hypothetical protein
MTLVLIPVFYASYVRTVTQLLCPLIALPTDTHRTFPFPYPFPLYFLPSSVDGAYEIADADRKTFFTKAGRPVRDGGGEE